MKPTLHETTEKISLGPGTVVGGKGKKWGKAAKIGKLSKLASLTNFSPLAKFFFSPFSSLWSLFPGYGKMY